MFSGTFCICAAKLHPFSPLEKPNAKLFKKFFKILFGCRTSFGSFLRFYPPFGLGRTLLCFVRSLNRASSPPLPRTRLRFGGKQRCTPALYFYQYLTAARMTPSACADRPAEPPHRRGSGRGAVTSALSLPYNMSFPPFACSGLRGVCGAIGAPF